MLVDLLLNSSKMSVIKNAKGTIAHEAFCLITQIMYEDNILDDLPSNDRPKQHQLIIKPMVDAYFQWVNEKLLQDISNSKIKKPLRTASIRKNIAEHSLMTKILGWITTPLNRPSVHSL